MAQTSHNPDIEFLRRIGFVLVVATMMAGTITLSLTLGESNPIALADITSGQSVAISGQLAMWQEPLE